jgi:hypothetical protein
MTSATTGRPEPVLDAAKIAAAVSGTVLAIGTAFVLIGWATADQVQSWAVIAGGIVTAVGALIAVVLPIITAYGARAQVTPLAAPVSVEGVPLITSAAPPVAPPGREITDDLRDLERADATTGPVWPTTSPISAVGAWTPATPAAFANEPTPIAAEAEAASTGRTAPVRN